MTNVGHPLPGADLLIPPDRKATPLHALQRRVTIATVGSILLTAMLGLLSWQMSRLAAQESDRLVHTYQASRRLQLTLRHADDVETGVRGYALTGVDQFLEPYDAGRRSLERDLLELPRLITDSPTQIQRLATLRAEISERLQAAIMVIAERRSTHRIPTVDALLRGKTVMDAMRTTVREMDQEERRLLDVRSERTQHKRRLTNTAIAVGSVLGSIFLLLAGFAIRRSTILAARAQMMVKAMNADLELRVRQRTSALETEAMARRQTEARLRSSEEMLRMLLDGIGDYAIYLLDVEGCVASWNAGAARILGYSADEIIGRHVSVFYPAPGDTREHAKESLARAALDGRSEEEALRLRKDGSAFWANTVMTALYDAGENLNGFSKVMRDVTARKRSDEELEKQAKLLNLAHDAIIVRDVQARIVFWNRGAQHLYGWSAEEAVGRNVHSLLQTVFPVPLETVQETLASAGEWEGELQHTTREGAQLVVGSRMSMQTDNHGAPAAIMEINRDITDRKRAEELLRDSEERFQTMVNGIPQLAWMAEGDGSIFWYNQRWHEYTGTTLAEMEGWGWQSVHHPDRVADVTEQWKRAIEACELFEMEFPLRGADGKYRTFLTRGMPMKDSSGKVIRWFGTNTDISERKRNEERLTLQAAELAVSRQEIETQKLTLQSILDSLEEGLVATDQHGNFIMWNPAAKRIIGMDATDLSPAAWSSHYGVFLADMVTPFPKEENPLVRAIAGEVSGAVMYLCNPQLEQGVWLETNAAPLRDTHGAPSGGVIAFRDITQRKADELEIRKLNEDLETRIAQRTAQLETANKELQAFTYSVSHDLRAPLRHISGFSRILVGEFGDSLVPEARSHLQRIQDAVTRMGLLVDSLLGLAKLGRQALKIQPNALNAVVEHVIAMLQPECEGRDVEWRVAALPVVECDRILLGQVFQNLIGNALKYSRKRAKTVIEVGSRQQKGRQPVIFVRDNGAGFEMKYATKLFEVFQRMHTESEFEGTGVGLATVHRIVQKHGGEIWAEATIDQGATFYFTLGASEEARTLSGKVAAGI